MQRGERCAAFDMLQHLIINERCIMKPLTAMRNDEIAAHLGEVLWVSGDKARAKSVWRESLQASPDSPFIRATLKRFDLTPADIAGGHE